MGAWSWRPEFELSVESPRSGAVSTTCGSLPFPFWIQRATKYCQKSRAPPKQCAECVSRPFDHCDDESPALHRADSSAVANCNAPNHVLSVAFAEAEQAERRSRSIDRRSMPFRPDGVSLFRCSRVRARRARECLSDCPRTGEAQSLRHHGANRSEVTTSRSWAGAPLAYMRARLKSL